MEGDLSIGGWSAWLEYTVNPTGNPFDAKRFLSLENEGRIKASIALEDKEIGYGGGYISMKKCRDGSQPIGPNICSDKSRPIIITPAAITNPFKRGLFFHASAKGDVSLNSDSKPSLPEVSNSLLFVIVNYLFATNMGS